MEATPVGHRKAVTSLYIWRT